MPRPPTKHGKYGLTEVQNLVLVYLLRHRGPGWITAAEVAREIYDDPPSQLIRPKRSSKAIHTAVEHIREKMGDECPIESSYRGYRYIERK